VIDDHYLSGAGNLVERTSDRTAPSSITVPKFLIMPTSAAATPSICSMLVSRGSAQVTIAIWGAGAPPAAAIVVVGDGRIGAQRFVNETMTFLFSFSFSVARLAGMWLRERYQDWDRGPFTGESQGHISV